MAKELLVKYWIVAGRGGLEMGSHHVQSAEMVYLGTTRMLGS